jgi:toxin ParE1/3/4
VSCFKLTPSALDDLRNIAQYTEEHWGVDQRDQYLTALDNRFSWLAKNPKLGKDRSEIRSNFLSYPEGMHVIFYRELDINECIDIIGVLHRSMDYEQHL